MPCPLQIESLNIVNRICHFHTSYWTFLKILVNLQFGREKGFKPPSTIVTHGKFLEKLLAQAKKDKKILAVMVFGSFARKEKYRDIDVALVLYKKHKSLEMSNIKLKYSGISDKLDVHVFQQLPLYIQQRVLKNGKVLLCKDEDTLYDLVFAAMREIDDFMPRYRLFLGVEAWLTKSGFLAS